MMFRKVLFWLHLILGIAAGIVILIMSLTGVLLTYEKQIIAWADREYLQVPSTPGTPRVSTESIVSTISKASGATPTTVTFYSGYATASAAAGGTTYFVNSQSGELLGTTSAETRAFFRSVTDWHRYIALADESRPLGKSLTGASNLIFLFIVVSGAFIWWRGFVGWFKRGLKGKALYWNWHHVFGVWTAAPLFLVVLSATVISYPWASDLVYTLTGTEAPPRNEGGRGAGNQRGGGEGQARAGGNRGEGRQAGANPLPDLTGVDAALLRAESSVADWRTIALRLPTDGRAPVSLTVDRGRPQQPQYRTTLTVDRKSGEIATAETYADQNLGRRTRSWLRAVHTGEYYGVAGQTIAGIASFAGVMLVWTGFALSLHRLSGWIKRRKRVPGAINVETPPQVHEEA